MLSCWQEEVGNRPTFCALKTKFNDILLSQGSSNYVDFTIDPKKAYYNMEDDELHASDPIGLCILSSPRPNRSLTVPSRVSCTSHTSQNGVDPRQQNPNISLSAEKIQSSSIGRQVIPERPSSMFIQRHSHVQETCRKSEEPKWEHNVENDRYVEDPMFQVPCIKYDNQEVKKNKELPRMTGSDGILNMPSANTLAAPKI